MEQQKFAYEQIENGIRILRCYGNSGCVKIPEQIEGQPVTELAAYTFAKEMDSEPENTSGLSCICGEDLQELHLPRTIKRLGRYIFYNCIQFEKFFFYSNISYMGAGAFTGCEKLSYLNMQEVPEEKSCLREILSDLKQKVQVKVLLEEKCKYELVYPEFFEEAEENTPARIINTVTHGMGIQYRNAFRDTKVIFREYDKLLETGKYNVDLTTRVEMAAARLSYPIELEENAKKDYILFLKKHLEQAANIFLQSEEQEKLRWLAETFVTTKEEMDILLKQAASQEQAEKVSMLMDIKHQRFSQKKKKFSL
ncbi:leucine-rich repeat protein [Roseburia sp. MSJ-14]|uniref:leucine-rich repeat protein n=1 Tax=Roseburia sp. MSJ-14 TaxID=2841514 RepID=UPI001C114A0C|nr:leucine-rich repeat protein [Roseburia sp. MSJ-14]MBU5472412.1 leucine-rich repeat domain-containing protein [Roseburia sp. MSJ-14]